MNASTLPFPFYIFCIFLAVIAIFGIVRKGAIFEFPTLTALIGLSWIVPQGMILESSNQISFRSDAFWWYALGCFVLISIGFEVGRRRARGGGDRKQRDLLPDYSTKRLITAAAALTIVGGIATLLVGGVNTSSMGGQWTGVITFYSLVSKASGLGLCLAMIVFARTKSKVALIIAIISVVPILEAAIFSVRREALFDLVILTAGSWFFVRRTQPPRIAILAAVVVGTIILNTVGTLRQEVSGGDSLIAELMKTETYSGYNFSSPDQGKANELTQAKADFIYTEQTKDWEYGAEYWNIMIQQYFPAFIFGRDIKDDLKIMTLKERIKQDESAGESFRGATRTGFSDTFRGFGYFGALIFGLIAYLFGRFYANSLIGGTFGQYLYLVLLAEGLKSLTHSTASFFGAIPFVLGLSLFAFQYAKVKPKQNRTVKSRARYA